MTTLLNLFYRLPLPFVTLCLLLISFVCLCARKRFSHSRWFRRGVWIVLITWFIATLWITILRRSPDRAYRPEWIPFHSYRKLLATGVSEIIRTNFMNFVLFYPAGFLTATLLPEGWLCRQKLLTVSVLFALFSLSIELGQFYYALGEPEIDDVIHNTVGAVCGAIPVILQNIQYSPTM